MSNSTITNNDLGSVILESGIFNDELLTFAGGTYPRTMLEGTILARDSVSLNLVPYVIGGTTNGNGIPKAVLTYNVVADAAGDEPIRDMIHGSVRSSRLVVDADGDASNITKAILDELRDYGLITVNVQNLSILDNQ